MKKFISIILILGLVFSLFAGCAKEPAEVAPSASQSVKPSEPADLAQGKTVAICMGSVNHPAHRVIQYGFLTKAEELGMEPIVSGLDEMLHDHIRHVAVGQCIACPSNQILRLFQIQFQRNRKRQRSHLGRFILWVIADFGKQFSIHVRLSINFRIRLSGPVNHLQERFGESGIQPIQQLIKINTLNRGEELRNRPQVL